MSAGNQERVSFIEVARRIIEEAGKPITADEVWQAAQQSGLASLLQSTGKTPGATLGAILYRDVKKPTSAFLKVGSRPAKFYLKALARAISAKELEQQAARMPVANARPKPYAERQLHPLLVWFADRIFGAYCRTIYHEKSARKGEKQNQWIHPDVVGFSLTTQDWTHDVVQLAQSIGALVARLYSFEVKIALDFPTLREFFFQAVSNSSWAHESYLVAVDIDEDPEFREELTRLSQSFGIGVLQLNTTEPLDSKVSLAAREKTELDWQTANRIAAVNPDFSEFIGSVARSVRINQPAVSGFDKVLEDSELEAHLKRM